MAAPLSPEQRATAFYFTQYMTAGAATVFGGIWFTQKGLSPDQIGVVNAVPVLIMLAINLFVGRLADRASDWRQTIVAGSLIAAFAPLGLFFAEGFWGLLIVWSLTQVPQAVVGPVADAATMRLTRRNGSDFGSIRAWATVGFMLAIFATGYVVTILGPDAFVPLLLGLALLRGAVALGLPNFRAPEGAAAVGSAVKGAGRLIEVMKPWFLLPLVGWAMVFGTHFILNAFQGLLWKAQGIPESVIGPLIALGALAEAAMMFGFRRFALRYPARYLILISALVSVLRWAAMGFSPPVPVLIGLQCLHAVTFALGFLGCVNFVANWTSEDIAAEAQSFFVVLQQAMTVIALVAFGWLVSQIGAQAYFVAALFALLGAGLIFLSLSMQPVKTAAAP